MSQDQAPRSLPVVTVVGRPNVGKSTLFNRLSRTRRAIVDSVPGITRDRIELPVEWRGRHFRVVDTGGIDFDDPETIPRQIIEQAEVAVAQSDLVLLLVDARAGLQGVEADIAAVLRRTQRPILVAANKADRPDLEGDALEFHQLGLGDVWAISAEGGNGIAELLDAILELLPGAAEAVPEERAVRIAVIGRPNVGKSSLVNKLLGENRVIVSDVPGTTRDTVDARIVTEQGEFVLVDTAGLKKKGTDRERIDHVARVMAQRAVDRCDVALLLVDAKDGPTHQDSVIGGMAVEAGAGLIVLGNKWDLVRAQEEAHPKLVADVRERFRFASWASVLTVSALTGERLHRLFKEVVKVQANRTRRVPTAELNTVMEEAMRRHQPPSGSRGREFRVKYLTQVDVAPPRFVAFTTGGEPHFSWQRFLENRLREAFELEGTPIVVDYRGGRSKPLSRRKG